MRKADTSAPGEGPTEVVALWTAVGIIAPRLGLSFITNFTLMILGFLSNAAFDRLARPRTTRLYKLLYKSWFYAILLVAQLSFILLLSLLEIR